MSDPEAEADAAWDEHTDEEREALLLAEFEFHLAELAKSESSASWLHHQARVVAALSLLRAELLPDERVRFGELERRAEAETESRPAFVDEDAH